jgi:hypothetical protein
MSTRSARRNGIDVPRRLTRYDLVLLLLPLPLLVGMLGAEMTTVPLSAGVGMGGVPSVALLFYGLFVDGPAVPTDSA